MDVVYKDLGFLVAIQCGIAIRVLISRKIYIQGGLNSRPLAWGNVDDPISYTN